MFSFARTGHLQRPGCPHRFVDQLVCLIVVNKLFPFGIPLERAVQADGDVAQVTHGDRPMTDLDVADRPLSALDAIEPVIVVVFANVQPDVRFGELGIQ